MKYYVVVLRLLLLHALGVVCHFTSQVMVFEKSPLRIKSGAGLELDINGQKALRAINPGDAKERVYFCSLL